MQNKPDVTLLKDAVEEVQDLLPIGEGGFKAVYKATIAGESEALKVIYIPVEQEARLEIILRVKREIECLNQCECPFIVKLGSLAPQHYNIQGHEYIIYSEEYLEGKDLLKLIKEEHHPSFLECKSLLTCLLAVISELKTKELIHRDIKPGNIIALDDPSRPYVILDFGIAFKLHSTTITMNPDMRQGTLPYMAPEMFQPRFREMIDYRSDIYSTGVTIYEYATGIHPIARKSEDDFTTMYRIRYQKPDSLFKYRPDLPTSFCEIIDQMIRKKQFLRPSNIIKLQEKMEAL